MVVAGLRRKRKMQHMSHVGAVGELGSGIHIDTLALRGLHVRLRRILVVDFNRKPGTH